MNNAYKVLQSPVQRAEYVLKMHDITIPEGNTAVASEFLLEIMERNEEASYVVAQKLKEKNNRITGVNSILVTKQKIYFIFR